MCECEHLRPCIFDEREMRCAFISPTMGTFWCLFDVVPPVFDVIKTITMASLFTHLAAFTAKVAGFYEETFQ